MTLRVATYNLFEGAANSYNRLTEFVHQTQLDVLCLQEVNGWQDNDFARLKDFTDRILFAGYAYGNSNTEYKVATVSKYAITSQTLHAEAYWHCALETHIRVGDTDLVVVNLHLDPWQETSRDGEIARLLAALDLSKSTIITGDFNSISRQDNYPPDFVKQLEARGISKFGTGGQLEFRVTDRLEKVGLIDIAAQVGRTDTTVPSKFSTDKDHEVPVRIDYMYVTPDLAAKAKDVQVLKSDLTDAISDHYPLIAVFDIGPADAPEPPPAAKAQASGMPAPLQVQRAPGVQVVDASTPEPTKPATPADHPTLNHPRKPWSPPDEPKPPTPPPAPEAPPAPPEPPKPQPDADGEVVMWSHDK